MKSFLTSAVCVAVLMSLYVATDAQAQRGAAAPAPSIGIVDVSYIFKNHRRFQAQMERMKNDAEATKENILKEKEAITREMEKLKGYKPGTPDYNKLEETITHKQADFNARTALQQKDFMERESQVYMTVYKEVADAVSYTARQRGMSLVLRFNGDPVEANNRDSILREINKPIVYNTRECDITPDVLDNLNAGGGAPAAPANARRPGVPGNPQQR